MRVIRTFKPQLLSSAKDLRELRGQVRVASADLHVDPDVQLEFIGACTAVARSMIHRPGRSECKLAVLREDAHEGLRATFVEHRGGPGAVLSQRELSLADIGGMVDEIDIDRRLDGSAVASLLKWIN